MYSQSAREYGPLSISGGLSASRVYVPEHVRISNGNAQVTNTSLDDKAAV